MEANHTKRSYKKKKESQTFYLACQILLVSEWKVVSPLLSPQSHSHVPGGGHPEEHLRPAVHRERAVEEVSDGRVPTSFTVIRCATRSVSRCCVVSHSDVFSSSHVRRQKHSDQKKKVRERLQNREAGSEPEAVCVSLRPILNVPFC